MDRLEPYISDLGDMERYIWYHIGGCIVLVSNMLYRPFLETDKGTQMEIFPSYHSVYHIAQWPDTWYVSPKSATSARYLTQSRSQGIFCILDERPQGQWPASSGFIHGVPNAASRIWKIISRLFLDLKECDRLDSSSPGGISTKSGKKQGFKSWRRHRYRSQSL